MNLSRNSRTSSVIQHIVRKIVEFNPAAESTFGFSRDEAIGQTLSDLLIPQCLRAPHHQGLERGSIIQRSWWWIY